jgi:diketogulonate reductase-like aldo/keto reductase
MVKNLTATLNNGISMPLLGLGCWDMWDAGAQKAVEMAIQIGYRLIDTAAMYRNEAEVGAGIAAAGLPREELFVTTKVNNPDQGYDSTLRAYEASCRRLKLTYVDLYLVHWPVHGKRRETWKALEHLYASGAVRAIGVCNYLPPFLKEMETYAEVVPAVNQCEVTPYLFQRDLVEACRSKSILLQAWSPLLRGQRFGDPKLQSIARKYGRTPAQMLIRWGLDHGMSSIPKSASMERLKENYGALDFSISAEDLSAMDGFNENFRMSGEDPMKYW